MLSRIRVILGAFTIFLLLLGSMASDYFSLNGLAYIYAQKTDALPIRLLSLVILIGAIGFACVRGSEADG